MNAINIADELRESQRLNKILKDHNSMLMEEKKILTIGYKKEQGLKNRYLNELRKLRKE